MLEYLHCFVPSDVENRVSDFLVYLFRGIESNRSILTDFIFMFSKI